MVVGSGVVVVVVSSSLISFRSGVLSKTLLRVSSSGSSKLTGGTGVVEKISSDRAGTVGAVVGVGGTVVVSDRTKFGTTGKRGTSLLPYRKTFETGFKGCGGG